MARYAAITFDDGPSPFTATILDILRRYSIPATFFVVGSEAQKFPDLIRRIQAEGHVIGNHTWNHPYITTLTEKELLQEILMTNRLLKQLTGHFPDLFRPPYGDINDHAAAVIKQTGLTTVLWNVSSNDWEPWVCVHEHVISNLQENSIILLHDGDQLGSGPRDNTLTALPIIIEHLLENGYQMVTVSGFLKVASRIKKLEGGCKMDQFSTEPVSSCWGYDRGEPIDRYYIEKFLRKHRHSITGHVLEVGDNSYTSKFGQNVVRSDVLNVNPSSEATFVGDLADEDAIPQSQFDCIILTQVIHLIYDVKSALRTR